MNLVIKSVEEANKFAKIFKGKLEKLFKDEKLGTNVSLETWKRCRFEKIMPEWLNAGGKDIVTAVYNRWFNDDKSFKATELKKIYTDNYKDVVSDKFAKPYVKQVMEPIDDLFLEIGNQFIKLCNGFTNDDAHASVVDTLTKDIEDVCNNIEKNGSEEVKQQLEFQLTRLRKLGDNAINHAEGVVFTYKGRLMKATGSFSAVNQALNLNYMV